MQQAKKEKQTNRHKVLAKKQKAKSKKQLPARETLKSNASSPARPLIIQALFINNLLSCFLLGL